MEVLTCSWLQWPLYCAYQLNCTLTTMYALKIYHMTLYSKSYYTNHSNNVAHHYDVPMCYLTKLLSKCLIQNITAMWALTSMCALLSHDSVKWMTHYTHFRNMGAHHCVYVDVVKAYFLKSMSYFTHHSNMGIDLCVCIGVLSCHSFE